MLKNEKKSLLYQVYQARILGRAFLGYRFRFVHRKLLKRGYGFRSVRRHEPGKWSKLRNS